MQTKTDAERMKAVGARPQTVQVVGSTKFDQDGQRMSTAAIAELRAGLGLEPEWPVFVAGSTNPGEDEAVIAAFKKMRGSHSDLRLIIAPRQLERADEIQTICTSIGLKAGKRSTDHSLPNDADVLILDSFGELSRVYAVGQIAFVGGTLIRKGGHSIIQPILQGKPVLFGPYTFKTRDTAHMAIDAGVGFEVQDAKELGMRGAALLADADLRDKIDKLCEQLVAENCGASMRCAEMIVGLIGTRADT